MQLTFMDLRGLLDCFWLAPHWIGFVAFFDCKKLIKNVVVIEFYCIVCLHFAFYIICICVIFFIIYILSVVWPLCHLLSFGFLRLPVIGLWQKRVLIKRNGPAGRPWQQDTISYTFYQINNSGNRGSSKPSSSQYNVYRSIGLRMV